MDHASIVRSEALWFESTAGGLTPLVDAIGDARVVLIGEATHGTHEFYRTRAELTKALIARKGFNLVAVEADWPDAYRVNRWVRHASSEASAEKALDDFTRFPRWMWRKPRRRRVPAVDSWPQRGEGSGRTRRLLRTGLVQPARVD